MSNAPCISILGAGGHAKVVHVVPRSQLFDKICVLADRFSEQTDSDG